jgi:hypothetical protein
VTGHDLNTLIERRDSLPDLLPEPKTIQVPGHDGSAWVTLYGIPRTPNLHDGKLTTPTVTGTTLTKAIHDLSLVNKLGRTGLQAAYAAAIADARAKGEDGPFLTRLARAYCILMGLTGGLRVDATTVPSPLFRDPAGAILVQTT